MKPRTDPAAGLLQLIAENEVAAILWALAYRSNPVKDVRTVDSRGQGHGPKREHGGEVATGTVTAYGEARRVDALVREQQVLAEPGPGHADHLARRGRGERGERGERAERTDRAAMPAARCHPAATGRRTCWRRAASCLRRRVRVRAAAAPWASSP